MKSLHHNFALLGAGLVCALGATPPIHAFELNSTILPIYQIGTSGAVHFGHFADAYTDSNRVLAGGTYEITCQSMDLQGTRGQRVETNYQFLGPTRISVSIPKQLPATANLGGFASLPRGTTIDCNYLWSTRAVEGTFTIGWKGFGFPIGGGETADSGSVLFHVSKPSLGDGGDRVPCIP